MKKKYIVFSVLLFLAIITTTGYFSIRYRYNRNYAQIYKEHYEDFGSVPFCSRSLSSYYNYYGETPNSLSDAAYEGMDIYYFLYYWNREVKDWLSREAGEYLSYSYYRVYERSTREAVGFVILSTGIDGKTDIVLSENDTLYTDDYLTKIGVYNLYNPRNYYENHSNTHPLEKPMPEFSLRDYFFGKKDLLLEYGNLKRDKAYNDSSLRAFYDRLHNDSINQQKHESNERHKKDSINAIVLNTP